MNNLLFNKIYNNLPTKKNFNKSNNKNNINYDKYNNLSISLGNIINKNIFNKNIDQDLYMKILNYFNKQKWYKIVKNNSKHYYFYDLQLIINQYGDNLVKKDKLFSYVDFKNTNKNDIDIRLSLFRVNKNIPNEIFPPSNKYFDMRKIHKIKFVRDKISYELLLIGHKNKYVSYEITFYTNINNKKQLINNFIEINNDLKLIKNLEKFNMRKIDNYDISKLSVSLL